MRVQMHSWISQRQVQHITRREGLNGAFRHIRGFGTGHKALNRLRIPRKGKQMADCVGQQHIIRIKKSQPFRHCRL